MRRGVRELKSILDCLELTLFLKTSGGKGYHVVVPLKPSAGWQAFRNFARDKALLMEQKWPDRYVSSVRKNKIFIDWIRNVRDSTSVAPYSLLARMGAHVSMPISWRELDRVAPDGINMDDAVERLKQKDPWENFFNLDQKLITN